MMFLGSSKDHARSKIPDEKTVDRTIKRPFLDFN